MGSPVIRLPQDLGLHKFTEHYATRSQGWRMWHYGLLEGAWFVASLASLSDLVFEIILVGGFKHFLCSLIFGMVD